MAISPEVKPRIVTPNPVDHDLKPQVNRTLKSRQNKYFENDSNSWIPYIVGIIILIVAAYFAYPYLDRTTSTPSVNQLNLTPVTPPIKPAQTPAPAAPVQ
jgi:hypothetical protein